MNFKSFVTLREAEKFAKKKINIKKFNWLHAGAEDNFTTNKNVNDLQHLKIKPFHLKGVGKINLEKNFLEKKFLHRYYYHQWVIKLNFIQEVRLKQQKVLTRLIL